MGLGGSKGAWKVRACVTKGSIEVGVGVAMMGLGFVVCGLGVLGLMVGVGCWIKFGA